MEHNDKPEPNPISQFPTNDRVKLNVGGVRYETTTTTLLKYPETLLGVMFQPQNKRLLKIDNNGEVFIDRDGGIFSVILNFYRNGNIIIPPTMSQQMVEQELEFFQIPSPFKQPLRTGETLYEKLRAVKERFAREHRAKFEGTYVPIWDNFLSKVAPMLIDVANKGQEDCQIRVTEQMYSIFETKYNSISKEKVLYVRDPAVEQFVRSNFIDYESKEVYLRMKLAVKTYVEERYKLHVDYFPQNNNAIYISLSWKINVNDLTNELMV
jgi:hypothetical protein